eukprot:875027-Amphidinium_carterae.2
MTHDLTATSSTRPDGLAGDPSSGGPSADEGQRSRTSLPAMSSTGRYHAVLQPMRGSTRKLKELRSLWKSMRRKTQTW